MINFKLNGKSHSVPKLSELTFQQFNDVIISKDIHELPEYLAIFCNVDLERILSSKITGLSIDSLHQQIFNIDIDKHVKEEKETITTSRGISYMKDVSVDVFGQAYHISLHGYLVKDNLVSMYEHWVYSLAAGLSGSSNGEDIQELFTELKSKRWIDVLPQAFFLHRRTEKRRTKRLLSSMIYIGRLRAIRLKMAFYRIKLTRSIRKSLQTN